MAWAQQAAEQSGVADGPRQELQIVDLEDPLQLVRGEVARGGGAVAVLDHGAGDVHGGPAAPPCPIPQVQVFDVGRLVGFVHSAQRAQFRGVIERATAAAVEDIGVVFRRQRLVATDGEVERPAPGHDGFAGLFAAHARGETDLRAGAEEVRDTVERPAQGAEEARLDQHVVIEEADVRVAGAGDAAVHGAGERERLGGDFRPEPGPVGQTIAFRGLSRPRGPIDRRQKPIVCPTNAVSQPFGRAVLRAVIDDDDFRGE